MSRHLLESTVLDTALSETQELINGPMAATRCLRTMPLLITIFSHQYEVMISVASKDEGAKESGRLLLTGEEKWF